MFERSMLEFEQAGVALHQEYLMKSVQDAADSAQERVLFLKGNALAYWLYSEPTQRLCSDIDVLLQSRQAAHDLIRKLRQTHQVREMNPWGAGALEMLCLVQLPGVESEIELDLHWGLVNAPLFANAFTFDELWANSRLLTGFSGVARGLSPVYALLHVCLHWGMDKMLGREDVDKARQDMHLLLTRLSGEELDHFVSLAFEKRFSGLCWRALSWASSVGADPAQADCFEKLLSTLRRGESNDRMNFEKMNNAAYIEIANLRHCESWRDKLQWLFDRAFPHTDYLRYIYGKPHASRLVLLAHRGKKILERVIR